MFGLRRLAGEKEGVGPASPELALMFDLRHLTGETQRCRSRKFKAALMFWMQYMAGEKKGSDPVASSNTGAHPRSALTDEVAWWRAVVGDAGLPFAFLVRRVLVVLSTWFSLSFSEVHMRRLG